MNGLPGTYPNNFNPRERFKSFDLQVCLAPKREDSVSYSYIPIKCSVHYYTRLHEVGVGERREWGIF